MPNYQMNQAMMEALLGSHREQVEKIRKQRQEEYTKPVQEILDQLNAIRKDIEMLYPDIAIEGRWAHCAYQMINEHIKEAENYAMQTKVIVESLIH